MKEALVRSLRHIGWLLAVAVWLPALTLGAGGPVTTDCSQLELYSNPCTNPACEVELLAPGKLWCYQTGETKCCVGACYQYWCVYKNGTGFCQTGGYAFLGGFERTGVCPAETYVGCDEVPGQVACDPPPQGAAGR